MIIAILAFSLLILANLAVFSYLSFFNLSKKMVTEKLMEGLNEAQVLLNQREGNYDENPMRVSQELAPRLKRFSFFKAVVVLDRQGNVVHRQSVSGGGMFRSNPPGGASNPSSDSQLRHILVQNPVDPQPRDSQFALEYNTEAIKEEVELLRKEFNRKLSIAIFVSLLFLVAGLVYVIWAYRRHQTLQMEARKADRLAYVGTLSSGLAHEIRNPLNSMNMNVQLIQEELEEMGFGRSTDVLEMLEGTRKEVRRLESMVSAFLAYARPTDLSTKLLPINDLIKDTLNFLEPEISKSQIKLTTYFDKELPPIKVDPNQMKQALINVIQNSVQVLQPKQGLEIATRKAGGDKVLIAIKDEGPGISGEDLKNIFKEFYSTKRGGTGLGLPIAQRIAELHFGGIKAESTVGEGSTFTFILPMETQSP